MVSEKVLTNAAAFIGSGPYFFHKNFLSVLNELLWRYSKSILTTFLRLFLIVTYLNDKGNDNITTGLNVIKLFMAVIFGFLK